LGNRVYSLYFIVTIIIVTAPQMSIQGRSKCKVLRKTKINNETNYYFRVGRYLAASTSGKKGKLIVVLVYAMRTYPSVGLEV